MSNSLIVKCSACGKKNRIPADKAGKGPKCGACSEPLNMAEAKPEISRPLNVGDSGFDREVIKSKTPVLVDFWAPWCAPCKAMAPVLEQVAANTGGRLKVVKVNIDDNQATASRYDIRSVPTLAIFKNGAMVDQKAGAIAPPALAEWLNQVL